MIRRGKTVACAITAAALSTSLIWIPQSSAYAAQNSSKTDGHHVETGFATYYSSRFEGRRTASGVIFRNDALVAAHPTLPFGTVARVTNLVKGHSVLVSITDRGPGIGPRSRGVVIDLSQTAAERLKMMKRGRVRVGVEVLELGTKQNKRFASIPLMAEKVLSPRDQSVADGLSLRLELSIAPTPGAIPTNELTGATPRHDPLVRAGSVMNSA